MALSKPSGYSPGALTFNQATVTFVTPGVERAGEGGLVPFADASQGRAPVLASVDQRMELIVAIAGDDHRLTTCTHRQEVIGVGDFTLVAGVDPVLLEDQFHLQVEQLRLCEHVTGDAVNTFGRTKIQTALNVFLSLRNASSAVHQVHPFVVLGST